MKTSKLNILTIAAIVLFITNCTSDTIPGDKINLDGLTRNLLTFDKSFRPDSSKIGPDRTIGLSNEIPLRREDLLNMRAFEKTYNGSVNAGLTVPGFGGITLGIDETNLNVYYLETKIVINGTDSVVYGIGYSIHYLFKKVKKGLDITKLPYVSASVQLESKKTQVYYSIQTYGIIGKNLVRYIKPTINRNFDVEGFGILQSSIDGIHDVLGDSVLSKSVKFTPQILKFIKPYEFN